MKEFWSLPLKVNASTLIPRPDTETLVEHVLNMTLPDTAAVLDWALEPARLRWHWPASTQVANYRRGRIGRGGGTCQATKLGWGSATSVFYTVIGLAPLASSSLILL